MRLGAPITNTQLIGQSVLKRKARKREDGYAVCLAESWYGTYSDEGTRWVVEHGVLRSRLFYTCGTGLQCREDGTSA